MSQLSGARTLCVYLSNACNFDCTYCDRDYIKHVVGGQSMRSTDVDDIVQFIKSLTDEHGNFPLQMLIFHGGEPFLHTKLIDSILDRVIALFPNNNFPVYIQTNGSKILNNIEFVQKWGNRLYISISYDFLFQTENRQSFDLDASLTLLRASGVQNIQFQFVIPIHQKNAFSLDVIKSIMDVYTKYKITRINLIPLRHIRGGTKFRVIIDDIDVNAFFVAFTRFIEILYVLGVTVSIDGHERDIDKHYFENHKQLIMSPDGLLYPEFDFLEYKMTEAAIGAWRTNKVIPIKLQRNNPAQENTAILEMCKECSMRSQCGLKYLYKKFDQVPAGNCKTFYTMMYLAIKHSQKLQTHPTLMHSIGV